MKKANTRLKFEKVGGAARVGQLLLKLLLKFFFFLVPIL